jgi:cytochrome c peroxidase
MSRRGIFVVAFGLAIAVSLFAGAQLSNLQPFADQSGLFRTFSKQRIDLASPFFAKLGTNDRTCASCHDAADGWSITPSHLQQRFQITQGLDPVFRPVDGANCPSADVSTPEARTSAYSLLLNRGLIRMRLQLPQNSDFSIVAVSDPYQCPETTANNPALYRRPLPSTNLRFLDLIMWDGREASLTTQAKNATLVHAEPEQAPTDAQLQQIVGLETELFTAQSQGNESGNLNAQGARGGPIYLSQRPFALGMNSGTEFNPNAFALYGKWGSGSAAQQSVARGENIFNNRPMRLTGVAGLNDVQNNPQIVGTCSTCHNTPNVGGSSTQALMNIGTDAPKEDLPSYSILCNDGTQLVTTDPGRAMVTGKCTDIGKFKVPGLRGLPARAPYFHNGTAANLLDVVNFYDQRFNMLLSPTEKSDLIAFLSTL